MASIDVWHRGRPLNGHPVRIYAPSVAGCVLEGAEDGVCHMHQTGHHTCHNVLGLANTSVTFFRSQFFGEAHRVLEKTAKSDATSHLNWAGTMVCDDSRRVA